MLFVTDAEFALMPYEERVRINELWNKQPINTLVAIAAMQDAAERNQNYRFDDNEEVFGGWDCD